MLSFRMKSVPGVRYEFQASDTAQVPVGRADLRLKLGPQLRRCSVFSYEIRAWC